MNTDISSGSTVVVGAALQSMLPPNHDMADGIPHKALSPAVDPVGDCFLVSTLALFVAPIRRLCRRGHAHQAALRVQTADVPLLAPGLGHSAGLIPHS